MEALFVLLLLGLLLFFGGLFLNLLLGVKRHRRRREAAANPVRLTPRPPLEGAEAALYRRIAAALPDHHLFADLPCARFLAPEGGGDHPLSGRRARLLICDRALEPVAAVMEGDAAAHLEGAGLVHLAHSAEEPASEERLEAWLHRLRS